MPMPKLVIPTEFYQDVKMGMENEQLAEKWGRNARTIRRWKQRASLTPAEAGEEAQASLESITPAPKIDVKLLRPKNMRSAVSKQPQVQVLVFGDSHAGRVTPTYNPTVFRQRLLHLYHGVTGIQSLQTQQHPIDKLVIFDMGDDVQGEFVGFQMELDEFKVPLFEQIYDVYIPGMAEFLISALQVYKEIEYYSVRGNHGKTGNRIRSRSTNWDTLAQAGLKATMANYSDRIKFNVEGTKFYQIVEILGWKYFITHGDVIKMNYSLPYYGIDKKSSRWNNQLGPLDAFVFGHYHSPAMLSPWGVPLIMNGTFVTDDEWAIGAIGSSGTPAQWTFGVHPDRPITWQYQLEL